MINANMAALFASSYPPKTLGVLRVKISFLDYKLLNKKGVADMRQVEQNTAFLLP
jgi:hypothetical protein